MTVRELIIALKNCPQDSVVSIRVETYDDYNYIRVTEVENHPNFKEVEIA